MNDDAQCTEIHILGRTNTYVNVTFQPANKIIICIFLDQQEGQSTISCDVFYGPSCQQSLSMTVRGILSSPNTVNIDLSNNTQTDEYCYVVASNGTYTVQIDLQQERLISSEYVPVTLYIPKYSNNNFDAFYHVALQ